MKQNKEKTNLRTCKATLYLESPDFLIPSKLKKAVMQREADVGAVTGHAFIGLTDESGKETVYGFHAATALPENANLSFKEKLPLLVSGKYQGFVGDDSKEPYDDKMVYHITPKQYDKIKSYVEKEKANPPKYNLFSGNCVVFAYKALRQADLKLPPQPLFYNPVSAVLGIRLYEKAHQIKQDLKQATANILSRFSSTRKISKEILQGLKKKPVKQAFGVKTVVSTLAGNTVNALRHRGSSCR